MQERLKQQLQRHHESLFLYNAVSRKGERLRQQQ